MINMGWTATSQQHKVTNQPLVTFKFILINHINIVDYAEV